MALRFVDSFDHYVTADVLKKWTTTGSNGGAIGAYGRNGTNGYLIPSSNAPWVQKTIDPQATWIVGFACLFNVIGNSNRFFVLLDAGSFQLELGLTASGTVRLYRNGTTLATGTKVLTAGVSNYFELKATIDNAGTAILRINGVQDINFSGDTQATGNATADMIRLYNEGNGVIHQYDDLYVCDGTGGAPTNDFLGDVRVETILPNGNGNSSQLLGSDADSVNNYLLVDETAPNDDTDYVESSTVTQKDTYAFGNVTPTAGTVFGVQVLPYARKTDAGSRSIVSVARVSAVEVDSADKPLSTIYQYLPDIRETKPGGGAWTITDVNAAEFGVKVTA